MFDSDKWQEIFATINKNKLRTFLTAFSVTWGIFILIVLLGAGKGLSNGAHKEFLHDAVNSLNIEGGQTVVPYRGIKPGRNIQLDNNDFEIINSKIGHILHSSAVFERRNTEVLSYGNQHSTFTVRSCMPDHNYLENATTIEGRFIDQLDIKEFRKVCAIGVPVKDALFKNETPIGKFIDVGGTPYKVVGVFTDPGNGDNERIYIPLTTAQRAMNAQNKIDNIWSSLDNDAVNNSGAIIKQVRELLAQKHNFSPADVNAIRIENWSEDYKRIMDMLDGINLFIWIIGTFTLIAGVVGVSNIMMIIVKERTKEIGVRKALGATPTSIVMLIVQEAIFITAIAGYTGLVLGVGLLQLFYTTETDFFRHPEVDFHVAISATILIIAAGALAGLFPALKAAKVQPVDALRDE
ncbi:MAG: ABC transporter permease [Bacteroidota bacterium]